MSRQKSTPRSPQRTPQKIPQRTPQRIRQRTSHVSPQRTIASPNLYSAERQTAAMFNNAPPSENRVRRGVAPLRKDTRVEADAAAGSAPTAQQLRMQSAQRLADEGRLGVAAYADQFGWPRVLPSRRRAPPCLPPQASFGRMGGGRPSNTEVAEDAFPAPDLTPQPSHPKVRRASKQFGLHSPTPVEREDMQKDLHRMRAALSYSSENTEGLLDDEVPWIVEDLSREEAATLVAAHFAAQADTMKQRGYHGAPILIIRQPELASGVHERSNSTQTPMSTQSDHYIITSDAGTETTRRAAPINKSRTPTEGLSLTNFYADVNVDSVPYQISHKGITSTPKTASVADAVYCENTNYYVEDSLKIDRPTVRTQRADSTSIAQSVIYDEGKQDFGTYNEICDDSNLNENISNTPSHQTSSATPSPSPLEIKRVTKRQTEIVSSESPTVIISDVGYYPSSALTTLSTEVDSSGKLVHILDRSRLNKLATALANAHSQEALIAAREVLENIKTLTVPGSDFMIPAGQLVVNRNTAENDERDGQAGEERTRVNERVNANVQKTAKAEKDEGRVKAKSVERNKLKDELKPKEVLVAASAAADATSGICLSAAPANTSLGVFPRAVSHALTTGALENEEWQRTKAMEVTALEITVTSVDKETATVPSAAEITAAVTLSSAADVTNPIATNKMMSAQQDRILSAKTYKPEIRNNDGEGQTDKGDENKGVKSGGGGSVNYLLKSVNVSTPTDSRAGVSGNNSVGFTRASSLEITDETFEETAQRGTSGSTLGLTAEGAPGVTPNTAPDVTTKVDGKEYILDSTSKVTKGYSPGVSPASTPNISPGYTAVSAPAVSRAYSSAISPVYTPPVSPGYSPAVSPGYRPAVSPGYGPQVPQGYSPAVSPRYRPAVSPEYTPAVSSEYTPSVSPGHSPAVSPGYASVLTAASTPVVSPTSSPVNSPRSTPGVSPGYTRLPSPTSSARVTPVSTAKSTPASTPRTAAVSTLKPTPASTPKVSLGSSQRISRESSSRSTPVSPSRGTPVSPLRSTPSSPTRAAPVLTLRVAPPTTSGVTPGSSPRVTSVSTPRGASGSNTRVAAKSTQVTSAIVTLGDASVINTEANLRVPSISTKRFPTEVTPGNSLNSSPSKNARESPASSRATSPGEYATANTPSSPKTTPETSLEHISKVTAAEEITSHSPAALISRPSARHHQERTSGFILKETVGSPTSRAASRSATPITSKTSLKSTAGSSSEIASKHNVKTTAGPPAVTITGSTSRSTAEHSVDVIPGSSLRATTERSLDTISGPSSRNTSVSTTGSTPRTLAVATAHTSSESITISIGEDNGAFNVTIVDDPIRPTNRKRSRMASGSVEMLLEAHFMTAAGTVIRLPSASAHGRPEVRQSAASGDKAPTPLQIPRIRSQFIWANPLKRYVAPSASSASDGSGPSRPGREQLEMTAPPPARPFLFTARPSLQQVAQQLAHPPNPPASSEENQPNRSDRQAGAVRRTQAPKPPGSITRTSSFNKH